MQIDYLKFGSVITEEYLDNKKIDDTIIKFGDNPKEGLDDILELMRKKKICIGDIPKAKQTKELLEKYLDMPEIDYNVSLKWISKKLLDEDIWKKLVRLCWVSDYKKIPQQYLTDECYLNIAKSYISEYDLHLIPIEKMTEEMLLEALVTSFNCLSNSKLDNKIFEKFDIDMLKEKALVIRERRQREQKEAEDLDVYKNGWRGVDKWYNPEKGMFFVSAQRTSRDMYQTFSFKSFDEFYQFILEKLPEKRRKSPNPQPLRKMDLMEYDFKDIDLSKYDLTGCYIRPEVIEKSGSFIDYSAKLLPDNNIEKDVIEETEKALVNYDYNEIVKLGDVNAKEFVRKNYNYISDIHLNHRILNQLGRKFTQEQIEYLFINICKKIKEGYGITLIAGDTSEYFIQNEVFYAYLESISLDLKVIVLGNHEFWDASLYKSKPIDDVIEAYRQLYASKENQVLLQNELLIQTDTLRYILSEKEILEMTSTEIEDLCNDATTIILGGNGFTGYCQDRDPKTGRIYNAEYGLYRTALTKIEEDIQQSMRFEAVYEKVRSILSDRKVIVLTHTPKECWSRSPYVSNWIYVNGHTHRNIAVVNEEKVVFADNQIGYNNEKIQIKSFCTIQKKDMFYKDLEDGIHEITVKQYDEFNQSKKIYASVRSNIGKILMLKKKKLYLFLVKKQIRGDDRLYILDGGVIHTAYFDEQYYYDNMDLYVKAVKSVFKSYWESQQIISNEIRSIGGDGTIHGCIIDIDYFNHVYLNPADGKLTYYYATSVTNKYVYENMDSLLQDQADNSSDWTKQRYLQMKETYKKQLSKKDDIDQNDNRTKPIFVQSTDMYKVSRVIKRLQHVADNHIIRAWHDGVLQYYLGKTEGQLMDFNVSFNVEEIEDKYEID